MSEFSTFGPSTEKSVLNSVKSLPKLALDAITTCGLVLTLTASGHVGFRTFSPLIRGLRIGLTPVLGSSVVLRWLSPALSGTLRFGFEDWLSPGGAWIWSAHVWSI